MNINGNITHNQQIIADSITDYFLTIVDKVIDNTVNINTKQLNNNVVTHKL
jgi:hypothetical protein